MKTRIVGLVISMCLAAAAIAATQDEGQPKFMDVKDRTGALGTTVIGERAAEKAKLFARHQPVVGKLRGQLLELADRHLQAGKDQAVAFAQTQGMSVQGDAVTVVAVPKAGFTAAQLATALAEKGATVVCAVETAVKVRVAVDLLQGLATGVESLDHLRLPTSPRSGNATFSQGVGGMNADDWGLRGLTGQGVKIAVIDGGFIGLSSLQSSDEIPAGAIQWNYSTTAMESSTEHGCGVAEIVYDMAPNAQLYLIKIDDEVDLQAAEANCVAQGIQVISHSMGWYGFNFYDGAAYSSVSPSPVTIANSAVSSGIVWVNSAGNDQRGHTLIGWRDDNANKSMEWASSVEINQIGYLSAGTPVVLKLTWNSWPTTSLDFDLYLVRYNGSSWVLEASSEDVQSGTQPPLESIGVNVSTAAYYGVVVVKYSASTSPTFILRSWYQDLQYYSYGNSLTPAAGSIGCPADAGSVVAVGAISYADYLIGPVETYSSLGPTNGTYTGKTVYTKPDLCGPDAVTTLTYSSFTGTSASAPHVAAAAALARQAFPSYSAASIISYLETGSANPDLGATGKDNTYGYGPLVLSSTFRTLDLRANNSGWGTAVAGPNQPDPTDPNLKSYVNNQQVTLTATPAAGCTFVSWSGSLTGSTNPATITMSSSKTITANFQRIAYALTLSSNPTAGGSIVADPAPDPNDGKYAPGTVVTLTANPGTGYQFGSWSGDAAGATNPVQVTMDGNKNVTANLTQLKYTLTLTASPTEGGTIQAEPAPDGEGKYAHGTVVTLTANANAGYSFANWSGDASGSTNPVQITLDGNKSVTANFTQLKYTLTLAASPTEGGTIQAEPAPDGEGKYAHGTVVTLTASANTGYSFGNWSGDASGSTNPVQITMDGNKSVTANFTQLKYTLTLAASPTEGGTIQAEPAPDGEGKYAHGTVVTLTANANAGYSFANWSGDASGSTNPVQVTVDGNKNVTANFTQLKYTLTLAASPTEGGTIQAEPAPDGEGKYAHGTVVTLTANANAGYSFANWSGDASGSTNPVQITVDGNKSVTANFTQLKYTLTLAASPTEGGTIQAEPAPDGEGKYAHGTVVTLTANANAGYSFANWSGDASGSTNPVQITVDGNKSVTANFTQLKYTLTLAASPTEGGAIQAEPAPDGEGKYAHGTVVTLTANANAGYSFANWSGDASGSTNPVQITVDGNKSVTANFTQLKYTLTLTANPTEGGAIQAEPAPDGEGKYAHGTVVTLTANPNTGYSFSSWSGGATGSTNPVQVTMDGNKSVTANFTQLKYTLTLTASPTEGGSIQAEPAPDGEGKYAHGTVVTLTASANAGYSFGNWSGDASGSTNPVQVTMDGNRSVTASFTSAGYTLTVTITSHPEWGYVQVEPNKAYYSPNESVTLTAVVTEDSRGWLGWTGGIDDSNDVYRNPLTLVMTGNKEVTTGFKCGAGVGQMLPLLGVGLVVLTLVGRRARQRRR